MKWSWRVARIAGIDVFIHATFFLLLGWIGFVHYLDRNSIVDAVVGAGFLLALFTVVVLHEFGHAFAARLYGIQTKNITLYPIGGVARLERIPEKPAQELVVALAGPAVNLVIGLILAGVLLLLGGIQPIESLTATEGPFLERLLVVNLFLAVFNMVPAFPMDGGRVLRALLAMRMSYPSATRLAATIGQGMALLFGFVGLFVNPFLILIAVFVWVGAEQEAAMVRLRSALAGVRVADVMVRRFQVLGPNDPIATASRAILDGFQTDFPVIENGGLVGVLCKNDLLDALARNQQGTIVRDVMRSRFHFAAPQQLVEQALQAVQGAECPVIPVLDGPALVGILTAENLGEFLAFQSNQAVPPQRPSFDV
ncbi:MAG: site-2 protease family protein [Fimbriimonadaceae bacterium]|nr:putative zinc metalloprotease Rip3 [Fimbriimonadaceae bacterium]MCL4283558.1 site-2 protease family protein [Fimbriimonadaceae bacterium]MCZ7579602.1 site-2 protease family protein [Fimbriimonadaceae bacterium]QOJ11306.1 MAG: site-2 protease family protein [Chthonomonadaceae bacterium]